MVVQCFERFQVIILCSLHCCPVHLTKQPTSPHKGTGKTAPVHTTKAYGGVTVQLWSFLTLALDGGEWECLVHRSCSLNAASSDCHIWRDNEITVKIQ